MERNQHLIILLMPRSCDRWATQPPLPLLLPPPTINLSMGFTRKSLGRHHGLLKKRCDFLGRSCYLNFKIRALVDEYSIPVQITIRAKRKKSL